MQPGTVLGLRIIGGCAGLLFILLMFFAVASRHDQPEAKTSSQRPSSQALPPAKTPRPSNRPPSAPVEVDAPRGGADAAFVVGGLAIGMTVLLIILAFVIIYSAQHSHAYHSHPPASALEWGVPQRDRGTMIFVFGLVGLTFLPLAIAAWVPGNKDLRAMRAGTMDRQGEGLTAAGRLCGMISVLISVAGACLLFIYLAGLLSFMKGVQHHFDNNMNKIFKEAPVTEDDRRLAEQAALASLEALALFQENEFATANNRYVVIISLELDALNPALSDQTRARIVAKLKEVVKSDPARKVREAAADALKSIEK
jgi:hypothetical protein